MGEPTPDTDAFLHFERTAHDRIALSYQTFFEPVTHHAIAALLETAQVGAGMRVLDVATGPGGVAVRAAARGAVVSGVDLAPRMIALATQRAPQLDFRVADVETLPFAEAAFDAVVCNFGVGHFPRPERAMEACVRVLVAGGRLSCSWWDVPARTRIQGVLIEAMQEVGAVPPPDLPTGPPLFRFAAADVFAALLTAAGLQDVAVQGHAYTHWVATPEALWTGALGSLARTAATILAQSATMQQRIREVFERLVGVYARDGGLVLPMAYQIASGRKPA
jgi:SAM-dependent methyltransferase